MDNLELIYKQLQDIQITLRKFGQKKYKYIDYVESKINTVKEIYHKFKIVLDNINSEECYNFNFLVTIVDKIEEIYKKILYYKSTISLLTIDMFNLKTTASLIPIMGDRESTTEQRRILILL